MKAAERVIATLQAYQTWPPDQQRELLKKHRDDLVTLRLVMRGALAEESDGTGHGANGGQSESTRLAS